MYVNGNKRQEEMTASPAKYPQGYFKQKGCRECGEAFQPQAPSHLFCSQDCADKAFVRRYLKKSYGITLEEYQSMHEKQEGLCAICQTEGFKLRPEHSLLLVVDHCHTTGKVRGMLCHNCNRALGLLQDNLENLQRAIAYLEGATTIPKGEYTKSDSWWKRTTHETV